MVLKYWEYFLSIESDLEKCSRYVDFSAKNYDTNSVEFARIIMAAAAEVDTVAKELCKLINHHANPSKICEYADVILNKYPDIVNVEMVIHHYGLVVKPWKGWSNKSSPSWWQGYNKIKHERTVYFNQANLLNAISAVAGLLLVLLYYYYEKNGGTKEEISALYSPKIFGVVDSRPNDGWSEGGIYWGYHLPMKDEG